MTNTYRLIIIRAKIFITFISMIIFGMNIHARANSDNILIEYNDKLNNQMCSSTADSNILFLKPLPYNDSDMLRYKIIEDHCGLDGDIFDLQADILVCVRVRVSENTDFAEIESMFFPHLPTCQYYQSLFDCSGALQAEGWAVSPIGTGKDDYSFIMVGPYIRYEYEASSTCIRYFFCIDEIPVDETASMTHHEIELNEVSAIPIITNLRNTCR